jgi:hypothetical protein
VAGALITGQYSACQPQVDQPEVHSGDADFEGSWARTVGCDDHHGTGDQATLALRD